MKKPGGAPRLPEVLVLKPPDTWETQSRMHHNLSNTPLTPARLLGNVETPAFHILALSLFPTPKIGVYLGPNPLLNKLQSFLFHILSLEQRLTAVFGGLNNRHKN